jgi:3-hydroxybutyryl-CoA dehydrogenase
MKIERVAVLGGGLMGSGIAESVAVAGYDVVVREIDSRAVDAVQKRLETSLKRATDRGKLEASAAEDVLGRIAVTTDLGDVADVDLLIEAVPEDIDLKTRVLSDAAGYLPEEAIITSNTSSIPIAQLAAVVQNPERVIGLHFFSPVPVMRLVEVVVALDSSDDVVATARDFVDSLGKKPIETKDRSGFIVNMLLVPYLMAGVRMYEEGFATREDIDDGMKLGCGHPMGPLTLCDFIGLDVLYSVCDSLYEGRLEPAWPQVRARLLRVQLRPGSRHGLSYCTRRWWCR